MLIKKLVGMSLVLAVLLMVGVGAVAHAQVTGTTTSTITVTTSTPVTPPVTTPGVPNTGAGGEAPLNLLILGTSFVVMAGAAFYAVRELKHKHQ